MNIGKHAFSCPASLIRPSRSAWLSSQIRYPYGRMTIVPRTGPRSTSSALMTTSLYQAEKSSLCGVTPSRLTPREYREGPQLTAVLGLHQLRRWKRGIGLVGDTRLPGSDEWPTLAG